MLYVSATPILFFMTLTSGAWRDYPLLGWLSHREVNNREVKIWMYFAINLEPMSSAPPFMGLSQSRHPLYFICTHTVCIFSSVHAHFLAKLCIFHGFLRGMSITTIHRLHPINSNVSQFLLAVTLNHDFVFCLVLCLDGFFPASVSR